MGTLPSLAYSALVFFLVRSVHGMCRWPGCLLSCQADNMRACSGAHQAGRPHGARCTAPACRLQGSFLIFWLVYWVSMSVAIALTLLAGAISPSVDVAGAVLPAYATTLLFFAGFMIPWGQLPDYWRWYATIGGSGCWVGGWGGG